jgi:hypothetical protein
MSMNKSDELPLTLAHGRLPGHYLAGEDIGPLLVYLLSALCIMRGLGWSSGYNGARCLAFCLRVVLGASRRYCYPPSRRMFVYEVAEICDYYPCTHPKQNKRLQADIVVVQSSPLL